MATQLQSNLDLTGLEVLAYRSVYFVNFKSTAIQRWAARFTKRDEYYTLNRTFWMRATDKKTLPEDAIKLAGSGHTMYFNDPERAEEVALEFREGLVEKGVL